MQDKNCNMGLSRDVIYHTCVYKLIFVHIFLTILVFKDELYETHDLFNG